MLKHWVNKGLNSPNMQNQKKEKEKGGRGRLKKGLLRHGGTHILIPKLVRITLQMQVYQEF